MHRWETTSIYFHVFGPRATYHLATVDIVVLFDLVLRAVQVWHRSSMQLQAGFECMLIVLGCMANVYVLQFVFPTKKLVPFVCSFLHVQLNLGYRTPLGRGQSAAVWILH